MPSFKHNTGIGQTDGKNFDKQHHAVYAVIWHGYTDSLSESARASEAGGMQGIWHPTVYVGDIDMYISP